MWGSKQTMLRVEHHNAELLDWFGSKLRQQVRRDLARVAELHTCRRTTQQRAAPQLDRRKNLRGFGRAHAVESFEIVDTYTWNAMQSTGVFKNFVRERERIASPRAASNDNGNQLVVAEAGGTEPKQLFTWTIVDWQRLHVRMGRIYSR